MAFITLLSELMQSLESNFWQKKTQRRLENDFILHIRLRLKSQSRKKNETRIQKGAAIPV